MSKTFKALERAEEEKKTVRLEVTLPRTRLTPATLVGEPPRLSPRFLQECIRLENKLQILQAGKNLQVLAFLSSVHGEGTSRLAASFAVAMAQKPDRRVLLMDFNFSSPRIHDLFALDENAGLTDTLSNGANLDGIIKDTQIENLKVVTSGTRALLHGKSIDRDAIHRLIATARQSFDLIIIDAPPVLPCPEFTGLGEYVDGTVFVIRCGKTRKQVTRRAKEILTQAHNNLLGVALNRQRYFIPQFIYKRL